MSVASRVTADVEALRFDARTHPASAPPQRVARPRTPGSPLPSSPRPRTDYNCRESPASTRQPRTTHPRSNVSQRQGRTDNARLPSKRHELSSSPPRMGFDAGATVANAGRAPSKSRAANTAPAATALNRPASAMMINLRMCSPRINRRQWSKRSESSLDYAGTSDSRRLHPSKTAVSPRS